MLMEMTLFVVVIVVVVVLNHFLVVGKKFFKASVVELYIPLKGANHSSLKQNEADIFLRQLQP